MFIALANDVFHLFVLPGFPQLIELYMGVEYDRRESKSPGSSRTVRMQADDEEGLFTEAEAEVTVSRVGAHMLVIGKSSCVKVPQRLQPIPEKCFIQLFRNHFRI